MLFSLFVDYLLSFMDYFGFISEFLVLFAITFMADYLMLQFHFILELAWLGFGLAWLWFSLALT